VSVSTHVLDAVLGVPAAGVDVVLEGPLGPDDGPAARSSAATDGDGRISDLQHQPLPAGTYRLTFATGAWFAAQGRETFYPQVVVTFAYPGAGHVHVPLLLSPFSYTTYRGS
jgi:5-hydroxyisourate hydrolase